VKLGGPKLAEARETATASIKALADRHAANVLAIIREIQRAGATSLHQTLTRSTLAVSACHTVASGYANSEQPAGTGLSYIGVKPFRGVAI
jgi:hypothetical protein